MIENKVEIQVQRSGETGFYFINVWESIVVGRKNYNEYSQSSIGDYNLLY